MPDTTAPAADPSAPATTTTTVQVATAVAVSTEMPQPEVLPGAPPAKTFWQGVARFCFTYALSIFMEQKGDHGWALSLGRVSTFALLVQAMWTWHGGTDLIPGQKEVLYVLIGYTFGGKALESAKDIVSTLKG